MRILFSVPGLGLEPRWVAPLVFETSASTDSAIRAIACAKLGVFFYKSNAVANFCSNFARNFEYL